MKRENFLMLLEDLYKIYSPSKVKDVSALADKYNGQEFDCVKYVYMTYNFPRSPAYDPKLGTDKHVRSLLDSYDKGLRPIIEPEPEPEPIPTEPSKPLVTPQEPPKQSSRVEVEYVLNFEEDIVDLPVEVSEMAVGSRMGLLDKAGVPMAIEVLDIFYDLLSVPGKCVKKVTINRL